MQRRGGAVEGGGAVKGGGAAVIGMIRGSAGTFTRGSVNRGRCEGGRLGYGRALILLLIMRLWRHFQGITVSRAEDLLRWAVSNEHVNRFGSVVGFFGLRSNGVKCVRHRHGQWRRVLKRVSLGGAAIVRRDQLSKILQFPDQFFATFFFAHCIQIPL